MKDKVTIGIYGIQDINNRPIPTISHDHAIAVMKNGKILKQIQIERIDRKKNSNSMPQQLFTLLKEMKLLNIPADFVFVDNIIGRSFINDQGNIRIEGTLNKSLETRTETTNMWFLDKKSKGFLLNHELAHLGSCLPFFGNFKENSLLIHFDGGASISNFSAWLYEKNKLSNITADWELKDMSGLFNANALVFGILNAKSIDLNSVPGKLMGFASYGQYSEKIKKWLIKHDYFKDCWKSKKPFYEAAELEFGIKLSRLDQKDPFIQNIAATMQNIFLNKVMVRFTHLQKETDADNLYFAGGSALNILLNTKLINSGLFKHIHIPPCCNDSGLAIGAAAFREWEKNNSIEINSPYLNNYNIESYKPIINENIQEKLAKIILNKKVVGICNGIAEIGPRALGNRSIVSLASSAQLAKKVSMEHKKREWYRPVAPIMLEENTKYFTGLKNINPLSKFMLIDFDILPEKQKELQGAVHTDGTARIQTIFKREENEFMYDLLSYLDKKHKVKALINTSFNIKGEPIVHTIEDAKKSAKKMMLDAIILNGILEKVK